jgi:hypothetical protein
VSKDAAPCLFCAALQARLDHAAEVLALAKWFAGPPGDVAVLPADVWRQAMDALAPGYVCEPGEGDAA